SGVCPLNSGMASLGRGSAPNPGSSVWAAEQPPAASSGLRPDLLATVVLGGDLGSVGIRGTDSDLGPNQSQGLTDGEIGRLSLNSGMASHGWGAANFRLPPLQRPTGSCRCGRARAASSGLRPDLLA